MNFSGRVLRSKRKQKKMILDAFNEIGKDERWLKRFKAIKEFDGPEKDGLRLGER